MEEVKKEIVKDKPKTDTQLKNEEMLEKIAVATEKLDKANKKHERLRALAEAEKIDAALDGEGEAGIKVKPKEETPKEYADKVMAGEIE